ncbi:CBS domain-containing protein [Streptomyces sp. B21-083]|uniref:CBS domain-containing protein n=1 Tax=Streptomyces sp. B21-083 TaxID=3039410 RepID=UPI002FF07352
MDVVRLLDRHRISGLPVVDDVKLVEVVCETDLIRREAARSPDARARRFRIPALNRYHASRHHRRARRHGGGTHDAWRMSFLFRPGGTGRLRGPARAST